MCADRNRGAKSRTADSFRCKGIELIADSERRPEMKTSTGVSIFLVFSLAASVAIAATNRSGAGRACATGDVVNVADGQRSGSPGVLLDEGDLAILRLIATQISPV